MLPFIIFHFSRLHLTTVGSMWTITSKFPFLINTVPFPCVGQRSTRITFVCGFPSTLWVIIHFLAVPYPSWSGESNVHGCRYHDQSKKETLANCHRALRSTKTHQAASCFYSNRMEKSRGVAFLAMLLYKVRRIENKINQMFSLKYAEHLVRPSTHHILKSKIFLKDRRNPLAVKSIKKPIFIRGSDIPKSFTSGQFQKKKHTPNKYVLWTIIEYPATSSIHC